MAQQIRKLVQRLISQLIAKKIVNKQSVEVIE